MSIYAARQKLQAAALAEAANLPEPVRAALSEALCKASPVDAIVGSFKALADLCIDLGDGLRAGLRACAVEISEQDFHGLGNQAALLVEMIPAETPPPSATIYPPL